MPAKRRGLAERRVVVGYSQEKLAEEVGVEFTTIGRWERGMTTPQPTSRTKLADALGISLEELDRLLAEGQPVEGHADVPASDAAEETVDDPERDPVLSAPWSHQGTVDVAVVLKGGDRSMKRRRFVFLTGATLTAPVHQWLIHEPGPLISGLAGRRISTVLIDQLTAMTADLRTMDDVAGGGTVLSLAEQEFGVVADLLNEARYDETTGRRLHIVLAELGQLCGWAAYDAGQQSLAQRYWAAGLRAAHTADDRPLGAHILSCMAEQSARQGRPAEAVTLIESALAGARGSETPALLAELYGRQAYALASLGDTSGCTAANSTLRLQIEQLTPAAEPSYLYWVNAANMTAEVGNALRQLGHTSQAAVVLEDGIAMFDNSLPRSRQGYLIALADVLARPGKQRDLDAAAARGMEAIQLSEGLDSIRSVGLIRDLCDQMRPHAKVPVVRDFLERARDLVKT